MSPLLAQRTRTDGQREGGGVKVIRARDSNLERKGYVGCSSGACKGVSRGCTGSLRYFVFPSTVNRSLGSNAPTRTEQSPGGDKTTF